METARIVSKAAWSRRGGRILGEGTDPSEPGRAARSGQLWRTLLERLPSTSVKLPQGGGHGDR